MLSSSLRRPGRCLEHNRNLGISFRIEVEPARYEVPMSGFSEVPVRTSWLNPPTAQKPQGLPRRSLEGKEGARSWEPRSHIDVWGHHRILHPPALMLRLRALALAPGALRAGGWVDGLRLAARQAAEMGRRRLCTREPRLALDTALGTPLAPRTGSLLVTDGVASTGVGDRRDRR